MLGHSMSEGPNAVEHFSQPRSSKIKKQSVITGIGLLWVAGIIGIWAWKPFPPAPERDLSGLRGTWTDGASAKHTYQFRANGDVAVWYEDLPMDRFVTWEREGQQIKIRTTRNWDFNGRLSDDEIRGQQIIRGSDGRVTYSIDVVWRRLQAR